MLKKSLSILALLLATTAALAVAPVAHVVGAFV